MNDEPFVEVFERLFAQMRAHAEQLPDAGRSRVARFIEESREPVLAVVRASVLVSESTLLREQSKPAGRLIAALERLGLSSKEQKVETLATALVVASSPGFYEMLARKRREEGL